MKKELNRYYLVEYCGVRETIVQTKEEVDELLHEVQKYNNRQKERFLYGNITVDKQVDGYHIKSHIYNKLTKRSKISEIDSLTSCFDEHGLINFYKRDTKSKQGYTPDINIAYFETKDNGSKEKIHYEKRIKYLPIMYSDDIVFTDEKFIKRCLMYHVDQKDVGFFKGLANEFCFYHVAADEIEQLYKLSNEVEYEHRDPYILYRVAMNLYKKLIYERKKDGSIIRDENGEYQISRRRLRDFAFYIKNYGMSKNKIPSPLKYNKSLPKVEEPQPEDGGITKKL